MRVIILWSDHKFIACCSSFSTRRRGSFAELDGFALLSLDQKEALLNNKSAQVLPIQDGIYESVSRVFFV